MSDDKPDNQHDDTIAETDAAAAAGMITEKADTVVTAGERGDTGVDQGKLKQILEAALLAADEPLSVDQFVKLFKRGEVDKETVRVQIRDALKALEAETAGHGYELKRVGSGYRFQVRQDLSVWISRLWEEKPPRYSRALLETLALVAYKQPVTRGDIEQVRGVSVSQNIMRTMLERGWIRVVGQREVPGRPAMYGTTRAFLDYFNLKSLDQLPPLAEIRDLIEPLVVEESSDDPSLSAGFSAGDSDSGFDADNTDGLDEVADVEFPEQEGLAEESDDQPATAEVVQLPTAPH